MVGARPVLCLAPRRTNPEKLNNIIGCYGTGSHNPVMLNSCKANAASAYRTGTQRTNPPRHYQHCRCCARRWHSARHNTSLTVSTMPFIHRTPNASQIATITPPPFHRSAGRWSGDEHRSGRMITQQAPASGVVPLPAHPPHAPHRSRTYIRAPATFTPHISTPATRSSSRSPHLDPHFLFSDRLRQLPTKIKDFATSE